MISIDPGVGGTGFAIWEKRKLKDCGTLHFNKRICPTWQDAAININSQMRDLLQENRYIFKQRKLIIEYPNFMGGSGGRMVASSGDLVKLAVLTGMIISTATLAGYEVQLVSPSEWKGQLPKNVCQARILKIMTGMGMERMSDHAWDAIGIGLWAQGRF